MAELDVFLQSFGSLSLFGALLVLLLVLVIFPSSFGPEKPRNEPPGPTPLPLIGNLLQIDMWNRHESLLKFYKKYGSVFTIYMGPKKMVVLAGYKTVKEALVNYADEFGERHPAMRVINSTEDPGVVWSNGDSWKEMRRFALMNLRDYGMGKKACEDKIIEESFYLTEELKKFKGEPCDPSQLLTNAVSNIISSMVYGSRFDYEDPEFIALIDRMSRSIKLMATPSMQFYNVFPAIGKWFSGAQKEFQELQVLVREYNLKVFRQLKETLNPHMCRGFVDAFFVRQQQQLKESGVIDRHFQDANLHRTVQQLFSAGTETTATTFRWILLFMIKYPKIQDQVQEEISRVVGSRKLQYEDRNNLPFTNAVIHESQRLASILPTSVPHRTSKDVTFQGYFIEKGTVVIPLLASVLHDETEWEKPHSFHPAHFLDKDGKFVKRDAFMPFSAGRRVCLGEGLARMELFLFFATLLQNFRLTPPPGVSEDDLDLTPQLLAPLSPQPYKLCIVPRT
ncbi:cytochrome P450 2K1-like isoform X1 [Sphaeramia orbicularis]|uniref:cytochrome P450 2K1-like isoform X1 n=1 Tax=Sphaeramia orbicularis TaxID=375764 RepID=UPI00117E0BC6|nr:cytochrome P450 2K1-like isoform X1 [Sphaeramia orbicularis]